MDRNKKESSATFTQRGLILHCLKSALANAQVSKPAELGQCPPSKRMEKPKPSKPNTVTANVIKLEDNINVRNKSGRSAHESVVEARPQKTEVEENSTSLNPAGWHPVDKPSIMQEPPNGDNSADWPPTIILDPPSKTCIKLEPGLHKEQKIEHSLELLMEVDHKYLSIYSPGPPGR